MTDSEVEEHPEASFAVGVAPGDPEDPSLFNSLRPALMTIACFRLGDDRFEFDSSFILPAVQPDMVRLGEMRDDYKDSPASIFGHADPVGSDTYNKTLSGNRARAFHALLTRDTDAWEALFNEHGWGLESTQQILDFLEQEAVKSEGADVASDADAEADGEEELEPLVIDGRDSKAWQAHVKRFQTEQKDLKIDGIAGKDTRKRLYELYMKALCVDAAGAEYRFEPKDFLGKGKDKKGKAAFQGCSEFNPILLLSESETKELTEEDRNTQNAPNRRVVLYFFPAGLEIDVDKWPCPRASEGAAACKKRFWSDHERRRKPDPDLARSYAKIPERELVGTRDTFACRFYDRFARHSPCEAGFDEWIVQLLLPGTEKLAERKRAAGASFVATLANSDRPPVKGITDANGTLRVRARDNPDDIVLELEIPLDDAGTDDAGDSSTDASTSPNSDEKPQRFGFVRLTLKGGTLAELHDDEKVDAARKDRLFNLGFGPRDRKLWDSDPKVLPSALDAASKQEAEQSAAPAPSATDTAVPAATPAASPAPIDDDKLRELYGS